MERQRQIISKCTSLLVGAAGLYILWGVWFPMITKHRFESLFDVVFLFIFPIPATCVAVYFLYTAENLWQEMSSKGIQKLSVCLSIIFTVLLLSLIDKLRPAIFEFESGKLVEGIIIDPIVIIVAGIFYLLLKNFLFKWFAIVEVLDFKAHQRATKIYWGFLAFSIWTAVSQTIELLPKDPQYEHLPANNWLACLIIFGSIPLAFWFYRIGLKVFLRKPPVQLIFSN